MAKKRNVNISGLLCNNSLKYQKTCFTLYNAVSGAIIDKTKGTLKGDKVKKLLLTKLKLKHRS